MAVLKGHVPHTGLPSPAVYCAFTLCQALGYLVLMTRGSQLGLSLTLGDIGQCLETFCCHR